MFDKDLNAETPLVLELIIGEWYIDFRTQCVIMTQRTWPPTLTKCVSSKFSTKSIVSLKKIQMSLTAKEVDYVFEEPLNSYVINCWLACLPLWIPGEHGAEVKKLLNLNSWMRWVEKYPRYIEYTYYFLISNCSNASEFLTEVNFCFISNFRNLHWTGNSKNEQIIIFYRSLSVLCSSDESVEMKHLKHHTFIGTYSLFTWFNLQIPNFC